MLITFISFLLCAIIAFVLVLKYQTNPKSTFITWAIIAFLLTYAGNRWLTIPGYSEGKRTIVLEKFSKKGFMFKTWEGRGILPGVSNDGTGSLVRNTWDFSVMDPAVIAALDTLDGKNLVLSYRENFLTASGQGETDYFITKVEVVKK